MDEDGLYHFNYDGTQPCNRTAAGASYEIDFRRWGACWHEGSVPVRRSQFSSSTTMGTSVLYLASVNDSYVSPQTFDNQPLPAYQKLNTDCFSIDNCTLSNGQPSQDWNTRYLSANCQTPMYTITNPKEELGVCYNFYNQTYFRSGCFDEKGSYAGYFSDALCTNPIRVIAYRYSCTGSRIENHCTAPITPLPVTSTQQPTQAPSPGAPTTPDSSASISHLSPLLTTIALIAAASLFFLRRSPNPNVPTTSHDPENVIDPSHIKYTISAWMKKSRILDFVQLAHSDTFSASTKPVFLVCEIFCGQNWFCQDLE